MIKKKWLKIQIKFSKINSIINKVSLHSWFNLFHYFNFYLDFNDFMRDEKEKD